MPSKKVVPKAKVSRNVKKTSTVASVAAEKNVRKRLPSAWSVTKKAASILWLHKQLFISITVTYGLLNLLLVRGFASGTNVGALKQQLDAAFTGNFGAVGSSLSVFVLLIGSAGNSSSNTAGAYQFFLALTVSLAVIWALRQVTAGTNLRARDAFYRGMYPLIPFILVLLIVALQLIPLLIGSTLYSIVITNGIAVHAIEKLLWGLMFGLLGLLTMYLLSASLFALYIVTLPDMTPMKALRSARELVRGKRWTALRKILFLPVLLLVVAALIMLPIIILVTPAAQWVFFVLTMFSLVTIHAYMYTLYRELLGE